MAMRLGCTNYRFRRVCVIAGSSGEGPLTDPTAAARPAAAGPIIPTGVVVLRAYTLPSRLRASWIEARVTKGGQGFREVLEVLGEAPVAPEPGEGALDHPAARQDDEALYIVAPFDDLQAQPWHHCHRSLNLPGVVATIGPDLFKPRIPPVDLVEHQTGPVAILDFGRVDDNPHRQPFAVDQGADFAALDPLAGVIAHMAVVTAPFSADLTDWLSRTAAEGLASRPIRSRNAMCSSAQIASQTPLR